MAEAMASKGMTEIINRAVVDYGFRLAVMWGPEDVISGSDLTDQEARILIEAIVPELKQLPDPVEPKDHLRVQQRLGNLAGGQ